MLARKRAFTLVELIVSVGLFAVIMTITAGAYLVMIGVNRQVQSVATGIDNLSFALEDMTRSIRTGALYDANVGSSSFSFADSAGQSVTYYLFEKGIHKNRSGVVSRLTDPDVRVDTLEFYPDGVARDDGMQARVTIVITGSVSSGPDSREPFTVETSATMRGTDL